MNKTISLAIMFIVSGLFATIMPKTIGHNYTFNPVDPGMHNTFSISLATLKPKLGYRWDYVGETCLGPHTGRAEVKVINSDANNKLASQAIIKPTKSGPIQLLFIYHNTPNNLADHIADFYIISGSVTT